MRKLEEIKKLYGNGSPIIDVTPQQVEQSLEVEEAPVVVEEEQDARKTRNQAVSKAKRKPIKLPYYPD